MVISLYAFLLLSDGVRWTYDYHFSHQCSSIYRGGGGGGGGTTDFDKMMPQSLFENIKGWRLLNDNRDIVPCISTMYFETKFPYIQPCIRNMKVISLTCIMTMLSIILSEEVIKYIWGVTM